MYSVSNCETARPPTTASPSGRRDSAPAPQPSAIGRVPASAHIARYVVGSKDDVKPGAPFRIQTAAKLPDGTYTATSISVGKDGGRPF